MEPANREIEKSWAWRKIPVWLIQIWMIWILVTFFVIRVLGSHAAQSLLDWSRRWR